MVNLPKQFIALSNWREVKIYWTSFIWIVRVSKIWKLLNHLNSLYATKNKFYYIRFEFMKEKRDNKTNPNSPDVIAFDKSNIIRKIYRIRRSLIIFQNMKIYISPPQKKPRKNLRRCCQYWIPRDSYRKRPLSVYKSLFVFLYQSTRLFNNQVSTFMIWWLISLMKGKYKMTTTN